MSDAPLDTPGARLPMREWAYLHSGLEWIYDHEVPAAYRERAVNKEKGGYWAWYIREGRVWVITRSGKKYEAGPGMWLLVPTEQLTQHFSRDARILSLHFLCQWPSGENILSGNGGLVFNGADHPLLERRATQLERMVRRHIPDADRRYYSCFSDYERFLSFHLLFQQWLVIWFRIQKENGADVSRLLANDDRLLRAMRCLNNAPLGEGLPHETLHKESGLSEAHLNRMFLAEYGMTVRKCWERRRLNAAKSQLETSLMPIKEVAYALGFRSDSHFMMWFKQHTGKRPKEYRQIHRTLTR
ncbi:MAG: AraC family transcriptional regulator [Rariglobus sp.]|jgi:AraC-like DNA-binding protein|nr:AraC family transcriptional regulator [Rariglobus sp.]